MGFNGINELKEHSWFNKFPWNDLFEKKLEAHFIPKPGDNFDKKYCEAHDKIGNETYERYQSYYKYDNFLEIFKNYTYGYEANHSRQGSSFTPAPNQSLLNNFSKNLIMGKTKFKISKAIAFNNYNNPNPSSTMKCITPEKTNQKQTKNILAGGAHFSDNIMNNQFKNYQSQLKTPVKNDTVKFDKEKIPDRLPIIYSRLSKSITKQKSSNNMNTSNKSISNLSSNNKVLNSTNNRITNSTSSNSLLKNISKYSTISANSTSKSNACYTSLHKRASSTNYFNYQ